MLTQIPYFSLLLSEKVYLAILDQLDNRLQDQSQEIETLRSRLDNVERHLITTIDTGKSDAGKNTDEDVERVVSTLGKPVRSQRTPLKRSHTNGLFNKYGYLLL